MPAVWMRFRAELRRRWPALLALSLVAGIFGGSVIAAVAAARRTDSVAARQGTVADDPDVYVPQFLGGPIAPIATSAVRAIDETRLAIEIKELRVAGGISVVGTLDERFLTTVARPKVLRGRTARPDAIDEVTINHLTERGGVHVGDRLPIDFAPPGAASEAGSAAFQGDGEAPSAVPPRRITFTVVGVTVSAGDLLAASAPYAAVTPAFLRAHPELAPDQFLMVWLEHGPAGVPSFRAALAAGNGGEPAFIIDARTGGEQLQRSFHLQAVGFWLLAAAVAFATLLVFGQTLARQIFLDSADYAALGALGFSRAQLVGVGMARTGIAAAVGAVIAGVLGLATSAFTPIGLPRLAEPDPGPRFDAVAILGGGAALVVTVMLLGLLPSWRTARSRGGRQGLDARRSRPSASAGILARLFRRPGPAVGARMALEPGRGITAVPVRTTLGGIVIGLAAFTAALTVAVSMDHLLATPRLYGWTWDAQAGGGDQDVTARVSTIPGVAAIAVGGDFAPLEIAGRSVNGMFAESIRGTVAPTILEGRPPVGHDEIAVGRTILREIGASVGDPVDVRLQGQGEAAPATRMMIVGVSVSPRVDDSTSIGDGAFLTGSAMRALYPAAPMSVAFVRFTPGHEKVATAALRKEFGEDGVTLPSPPSSVLDFGEVSEMPLILAGLLGALAAGTLAHGLVTTVRRRRRDLAILKCLGFVRAQVRGAVAWQATILAVLTLLVSLPLGIAAGRWLWSVLAHTGGFVIEPRVPIIGALITIPVAIALANLVAAIPARIAARMQPSAVLRVE